MNLVNVVEEMVWQTMDDVLKRSPAMCQCDKCRSDIAAYALNRLTPRYVSSYKGAAFARAESLGTDFYAALLVILTEAVEVVGANPRHEKE